MIRTTNVLEIHEFGPSLIAALPEKRRQGIGDRMLRQLVPRARERWPGVVFSALVEPGSPGHAFFRTETKRLGLAERKGPEHISAPVGRVMAKLAGKVGG